MSGTTDIGGSGQGDDHDSDNRTTDQSASNDNGSSTSTIFSMGDLLRGLAMIADQQAQQIALLQNLSTYLTASS